MKYAIIAAILLTSCSSNSYVGKSRTRKYLDKRIESTQRQFTFENNQIIIFENLNIN